MFWIYVNCGVQTDTYYEMLGYQIPRRVDRWGDIGVARGTKILVKLNDLLLTSNNKIRKICDICNKHIENQSYNSVIKSRKDGLDRCFSCGKKRAADTRRNNVAYERSLEYYAKMNNKEHLLNEFSDENTKRPHEISYGSNDSYWWKCFNCTSNYDKKISDRTSGGGNCPYCHGTRKRINSTNCLWTTAPNIAKLLWNKDDGYRYTKGSHVKLDFKCPNCNLRIRNKTLKYVVSNSLSCPRCSDGVSYPERFITEMLIQLNIYFVKYAGFPWAKIENNLINSLNGLKYYDFFIPSLSLIIEAHGLQHYQFTGFANCGGRTFEEEEENDRIKEYLAINNGIRTYVIIDCSKSDSEYIMNNIQKSKLYDLLNLSDVDWMKCHESACQSLVRTASELWSSGLKTSQIMDRLRISRSATINYLKQGSTLGWCLYNSKEQCKKPVVRLSLNNEYVDEFTSIREAAVLLSLQSSKISNVCANKRKTTGGFRWMYKEDYLIHISNI